MISNNKIVKSIFLAYEIKKIYVNQNKAFIGECDIDDIDSRIAEYEIDKTGNYKLIYSYENPHKFDITDIIQVKDGRLITSSGHAVKIWYD